MICRNCGIDFIYSIYAPGNGKLCRDCYNLYASNHLQKYGIKSYLPVSKKKKAIRLFYNCKVIEE